MGESFNSLFCGHMAACVEMDLPLQEGLQLLIYTLKEEKYKSLLKRLQKKLSKTELLYEAMKQAGGFSNYMVEMIGVGEKTGHLSQVLWGLEQYFTKEEEMKSHIKSMLYYPLVLGSIMLGIFVLLLSKVFPLFEEVFQSVEAPLLKFTEQVILYGKLISSCTFALLIIFMICGIVTYLLLHTERGKGLGEEILKDTKIGQTLSQFQLLNAVVILLEQGQSLKDAIRLSSPIVRETGFKNQIEKSIRLLEEGHTLEEGLYELKIFTKLQRYEIDLAYQLGYAEKVILPIMKRQEEALSQAIQRKLERIEPLFVGSITIIIVLLLIAIILPLLGMIKVL